jgi:perosamine synthetase
LQLPLERTSFADNLYWVFGVVLKDRVPFDAREAIARLRAKGVDARHFFWPMHEQPVFRKLGLFAGTRCPVAERIARRGLFLPSGVGTTREEVDQSAQTLLDVLK